MWTPLRRPWAVTTELSPGSEGHGSSTPSPAGQDSQGLKPAWSNETVKESQASIPYRAQDRAFTVHTDHDPCPPVSITFPKISCPLGHLIYWPQGKKMTYLINKSGQVPKFKPATRVSSLNFFRKEKCYLLGSPLRPHKHEAKTNE